MEPEKKRLKKEGDGNGKEELLIGDTDDKDAKGLVVVRAGLQALPQSVLLNLISFVGSYLKDCKSLVTLRAVNRRLQSISDQVLEASVLKRELFNRYDDWMFCEDMGTPLRTPSLGLKWSEEYSTRDNVVKKALSQLDFYKGWRGLGGAEDAFVKAATELQSGAQQIQIGDFRSQRRERTCGCDECSWEPIDRAAWTYGWKIRATCEPISAERAREIIGEICDLSTRRQKRQYLESHVERREHPELFVAEPNYAGRRRTYSDAADPQFYYPWPK